MKMLHNIYLALGSNLGERETNLHQALEKLGFSVEITLCSAVYDTAPVGNSQQPRFLNMVCFGKTALAPLKLLDFAKKIEADIGRKPGPVNSPRPIDIDILFYDDIVMDTPRLKIPHPRIQERVFVLLPLSEIAPELKHPVTKQTVEEMVNSLHSTSGDIVKL
jgi:2-amino-4-hydroxy-6-hydroxymethyldihydropteridine diphosphokinase